MDHNAFRSRIDRYFEGKLDTVQEREFRQHGQACPECRKVLENKFWSRLGDGFVSFEVPTPQECLSDETLQRWAACQLSIDLLEPVSDHITRCRNCAKRANRYVIEISTSSLDGSSEPQQDPAANPLPDPHCIYGSGMSHATGMDQDALSSASSLSRDLHRKRDVSRRGFLEHLGRGAASISFSAASILRFEGIVAADCSGNWFQGPAFFGESRQPVLSRQETAFLSDVLCGDSSTLNIIAGTEPNDASQAYPDDRWASSSIATQLLRMPDEVPTLLHGNLPSGSVLGVASPSSIPGIEPIFGDDNPLDLAIRYVWNKSVRREGARYYDKGGNWKIGCVGKGIVVRSFTPMLVDVHPTDHCLLTDYLLITVVPNPMDLNSRFALVAGAHGVATQSIIQLFASGPLKEWLFNNLADCKQRSPFFQAWFRIIDIRHDPVKKESIGHVSQHHADRGFVELPFESTLERAAAFYSQYVGPALPSPDDAP